MPPALQPHHTCDLVVGGTCDHKGCIFVDDIGAGRAVLTLSAGLASPADAATPAPYLRDSTIVGSGGTLTITDVPVQTSTAGSLVIAMD
jgi:hypothetical protein